MPGLTPVTGDARRLLRRAVPDASLTILMLPR
jgi:hypothetical protein